MMLLFILFSLLLRPRFQREDDDEYDDEQDDDRYAGPFPRVFLQDPRLLKEVCSSLNMLCCTCNLRQQRHDQKKSGTN